MGCASPSPKRAKAANYSSERPALPTFGGRPRSAVLPNKRRNLVDATEHPRWNELWERFLANEPDPERRREREDYLRMRVENPPFITPAQVPKTRSLKVKALLLVTRVVLSAIAVLGAVIGSLAVLYALLWIGRHFRSDF